MLIGISVVFVPKLFPARNHRLNGVKMLFVQLQGVRQFMANCSPKIAKIEFRREVGIEDGQQPIDQAKPNLIVEGVVFAHVRVVEVAEWKVQIPLLFCMYHHL